MGDWDDERLAGELLQTEYANMLSDEDRQRIQEQITLYGQSTIQLLQEQGEISLSIPEGLEIDDNVYYTYRPRSSAALQYISAEQEDDFETGAWAVDDLMDEAPQSMDEFTHYRVTDVDRLTDVVTLEPEETSIVQQLLDAQRQTRESGGRPEKMLVHPDIYLQAVNEIGHLQLFQDLSGYQALTLDGVIVESDFNISPGEVYVIDENNGRFGFSGLDSWVSNARISVQVSEDGIDWTHLPDGAVRFEGPLPGTITGNWSDE